MTLDELWEKWSHNKVILKGDFLAALKEYGESVRQQAVRVAADASPNPMDIGGGDYPHEVFSKTRAGCAAAIEKMEIT